MPPEWRLRSEQVAAAVVDTCNLEVLQLYMRYGLDVNTGVISAPSLLYAAVSIGCEPMTQLLLERGADPNVSGPLSLEGEDMLTIAAGLQQLGIVRLLLKHGADVHRSWALHEAARLGDIAIAELLLEAGADFEKEIDDEEYDLVRGDSAGPLTMAGTPGQFARIAHQEAFAAWMDEKVLNLLLQR